MELTSIVVSVVVTQLVTATLTGFVQNKVLLVHLTYIKSRTEKHEKTLNDHSHRITVLESTRT